MSALRDAIVLHLQADANVAPLVGNRIFPGLPAEGSATYPFIAITTQRPSQPERVFRGGGAVTDEIAFEDASYLVKAIDQNTSAKQVGEINAAIRTSLDGAAITLTDYELVSLTWTGDVGPFPELANSKTYQHEGGIYQIWANKT